MSKAAVTNGSVPSPPERHGRTLNPTSPQHASSAPASSAIEEGHGLDQSPKDGTAVPDEQVESSGNTEGSWGPSSMLALLRGRSSGRFNGIFGQDAASQGGRPPSPPPRASQGQAEGRVVTGRESYAAIDSLADDQPMRRSFIAE